MKKILKLIFILSLLMTILVACQKDKEKTQAQTNVNQPQEEQSYDYEKMLYVNEARFNASGDLIVLFSEELDKTQNLKDFVQVEGLDNGNITIMPFLNKIIIKGNFQKEVAYSVKISQGIKGISGVAIKNDFFKNKIFLVKKKNNM